MCFKTVQQHGAENFDVKPPKADGAVLVHHKGVERITRVIGLNHVDVLLDFETLNGVGHDTEHAMLTSNRSPAAGVEMP